MGLRSGVAIDLGTVNTLVYVTGRGIVIDEPTAIGIDRRTGTVAAAGLAADALTGKETLDVEVLHPLRDGVIADLEATVAMLQAFLVRARVRRGVGRVPCVICLPGEATEVERQSVAAAGEALRPRFSIQLVDEPVAAAAGAGFDLEAGKADYDEIAKGGLPPLSWSNFKDEYLPAFTTQLPEEAWQEKGELFDLLMGDYHD